MAASNKTGNFKGDNFNPCSTGCFYLIIFVAVVIWLTIKIV